MVNEIKAVYQKGYSRVRAENDARLMTVLSIVRRLSKVGPFQRILDIGCGDGGFSMDLANASGAGAICGVDISEEAVAVARGRGIDAFSLDLDGKTLPFANGVFDLVYSGSLIELVQDPDHLLFETHRVLSPTGTAVLTFPNLCAWGSRISVAMGFHPFYDRVSRKYNLGKIMTPVSRGESTGFIRLFTSDSFSVLAGLYGLEVVSLTGARDLNLPRFFQVIDRVLSCAPSLAFQVVAVLKRSSPA